MQAPEKYRLALLWYLLVPVIARLFDYLPGKLGTGEDLPKGVALQWAQWCRKRRFFLGDRNVQPTLHNLTCPILAYHFSDDPWGTPKAVHAIHNAYTQATVEYRPVNPAHLSVKSIGHLGFFKPNTATPLWEQSADSLFAQVR